MRVGGINVLCISCVIGLWAIYSSWFCKFTCSKLEAPHLGCKNELVGDKKKNVLALVWVELMWYTVYCSSLLPFFFFFLKTKVTKQIAGWNIQTQ